MFISHLYFLFHEFPAYKLYFSIRILIDFLKIYFSLNYILIVITIIDIKY